MQIVGILTAIFVIGALMADEGEVVTLVTRDAERDHRTHVWIVDVEGQVYLRANQPDALWLERLRARPEVEIVDHVGPEKEPRRYYAVIDPDPILRERVNRAMAEKYGFADRVWGRLGIRSRTVPVRLSPSRAEGRILARPDEAAAEPMAELDAPPDVTANVHRGAAP